MSLTVQTAVVGWSEGQVAVVVVELQVADVSERGAGMPYERTVVVGEWKGGGWAELCYGAVVWRTMEGPERLNDRLHLHIFVEAEQMMKWLEKKQECER